MITRMIGLFLLAQGAASAAPAQAAPWEGNGLPLQPPGLYAPLSAEAHRDAPTSAEGKPIVGTSFAEGKPIVGTSFAEGKPIVGTSYFYWYDIHTDAHIHNHDGSDALTNHPADMEDLSFRSPAWHRRQLEDIVDGRHRFHHAGLLGGAGQIRRLELPGPAPARGGPYRPLRRRRHPARHRIVLRYQHPAP